MKQKNPKLTFRSNSIYSKESRLVLSPITIKDASNEYVKWLNSKEINQYLESRFIHHTKKNLIKFITHILKDKSTYFFVILRKDNGKHIGNIKLGPINSIHKIGEIGIMIGNKDSWGQEYATEAISLLSNFAFQKLKLHKITAGAYENNMGSIKAFLKAGFIKEAIRKSHFMYKKNYVDLVLLAKLQPKI